MNVSAIQQYIPSTVSFEKRSLRKYSDAMDMVKKQKMLEAIIGLHIIELGVG